MKHVPYNCLSIQFADDFVMLSSGSNAGKILENLSRVFSSISGWLSSIGLSLSIVKTQVIVFNRTRSITIPSYINLNSTPVQLSSTVKYLGLTLNAGLRWRTHIKNIEIKSIQYINILKWMAGPSWGISPGAACYFINATIAAQILWGSPWFFSACDSSLKTLSNKLGSFFKIALGLPRSSANRAVWTFSCQSSLPNKVAKYCDKFLCKVIQLGHRNIRNKIEQLTQLSHSRRIAKRNIPYIIGRWEKMRLYEGSLYKWDIHPKFSYPIDMDNTLIDMDLTLGKFARFCGNPNFTFNQLISSNQSSDSELRIFTDGSRSRLKNQNHMEFTVGSAFWIPKLNLSSRFKLTAESSSFAAEAYAILKALLYIKQNNISHSIICSDSLSCLQAIISSDYGKHKLCPLVRNIKSVLHFLTGTSQAPSIRFAWCPAHCGIRDNERVDSEAKAAARTGLLINNKVDYRQLISFLSADYWSLDTIPKLLK